MIDFVTISVTPAGSAGSATGNTTTNAPVNGKVLAVYVDYSASTPATADVTIATSGGNYPANTILTVSNNNSDGWYYPRHTVHDEVAAAITYNGTQEVHEPVPVADAVKVTVAQTDADEVVTVYLLFER